MTHGINRTDGVPVAIANHNEERGSAMTWSAVFAGAVAASAVSFILLALGAGIGLSFTSPFQHEGASSTTLGLGAVIWLVVVQLIAYATGGYIAGRLRTRGVAVHTHEIKFRDGAHGFVVWALSTVVATSLLASALGSVVSSGAQMGATAISGIASGAGAAVKGAADSTSFDPTSYFVDGLFRTNDIRQVSDPAESRSEIVRIFANSARNGELSAADRTYVARVVATQTGISQSDAERRVADTEAQIKQGLVKAQDTIKQSANTAAKAGAYLSFWTFMSMLIGCVAATLTAVYAGEHRDEHYTHHDGTTAHRVV